MKSMMNTILTPRTFKRFVFMLVYAILYFSVFQYIEATTIPKYILDTSFDEWLPFIPAFIVPYIAWFPFLGCTGCYFAFFHSDETAFSRFVKAFTFGVLVFLVCSIMFPNGQHLRPFITPDTPYYPLLHWIYSSDTTTNIFPSLHVYLGTLCGMALLEEVRPIQKNMLCRFMVHTLVTMIILSTMFIKAHSVLDVISALFLNVLCYEIIYVPVRIKEKVHA